MFGKSKIATLSSLATLPSNGNNKWQILHEKDT